MDKDIESADEGQRNSDRWSGNHYDQLARVTAQALPELKLPSVWIEMGGNESETRQSVRKEKQRVNERRVTHHCQIDADMDLLMAQLQKPSAELEIPYLHLSKGLAELPIPCTSDDRASQQDTGLQSQFQTTESVVCEESLSESDPNATCGSGFFRDRSNEGEEWSRSRQSEATESSTFPRQESLSKYNPDEICESTCRPLNSCSDEEMQTERESNSCDQREATESVPYQESLSENDPDATCWAGYWQQAIGTEMGGNESETRQSVRKEKQRVNERRVTHYYQIDAYMILPMAQLQWPSAELEIPYLHLSKGLAELPIPCTSDDRASQQDTGLQSQFQTTESVVCEESLSESDPNATCGSGFFRDRSNEGEEWSRSRQSEATESSTFPRQESLSKYNPDEICESTCRPLNSCSDEEMQTERESNSCDQREATESVPYQESLSENDPDATCGAGYWQQAIGIEMGGNESETRQSVRKEKQRVNERRVTHYCQIDAYMDLLMAQLQKPSAELEIPYLHLSKGLAELPILCTSDDRASQQDTGLQSQFQTTESVVCEESLSESDPNATCGSGFFRDRSNEGEEWSRSRQSEATESSTFPRQESLSKYNPDEICESTCRPLNSCSDEEMQTERESNSCDQREATESVSYQESLSQNDPDATCWAGYWQQAIGSSVVASFNAYLELPCLIRRDEEELWGGHVLHDVPFQPPIPPREQARTYEQNNSQEASAQGASQKSGGKNSKKGKKKKGHYVELAGLIAPELAKLNGVMNGRSEEHETTPTNGAAGIMESEGVAVLHHMHATSQNTLVTSQKTHTSSRRSRNSSGARAAAEYCRLQVQEQQKLIDNMAPELQAVVIEMIRRDEEELGGSHVLHDVLFQPPIPPREQAGTYEQNNSQEASVQGASQKSGGRNAKKGKKKKGHYVELAGLIAPELAKLNGVMNGHSEGHETTATNGAAGTVESDGVSQVVVGYSSQGENSAQHGTHHNGAYSRFPRSSHQGLWGGTSRDQSHAQTSQPNRQGRGNGNHSMGGGANSLANRNDKEKRGQSSRQRKSKEEDENKSSLSQMVKTHLLCTS